MSHSLESALKRLKGSAYIAVVYKCMHLYFHHVIRNYDEFMDIAGDSISYGPVSLK